MNRLKSISEAITYTSEKIDEFVQQATKDLQDTKRIFNVLYNKVTTLSLADIASNPTEAAKLKETTNRTYQEVGKRHTKYYDVVDLYDITKRPSNVKQLDKLTDSLDQYYFDLMNLDTALDELISSAEKLGRLYTSEK